MTMTRQSDLLASLLPKTGVPVLLTRPQAEGEAFAKALLERFSNRVRPVVAPLIAPRFLSPDVPSQDFAAVVFTSAQAVKAARQLQMPLPQLAYCVGRKTAASATAAGFNARSADGDVTDLLAMILSDKCKGPLLYLRGVDTVGDLEKTLLDYNIAAVSLHVYIQEPQIFSPEAIQLLRAPDPMIVPLFSPRTARLFRHQLPTDAKAPLHVAAMSAAVAEALDGLSLAALVSAHQPDAPGMLDAVETLLTGLPSP